MTKYEWDTANCDWCSEEYEIEDSDAGDPNTYCSQECQDESEDWEDQ